MTAAPVLLSIVTPVYNGERFIASCLENVISQECPVVEHLIIDGGSTDGTVVIVRSYAERYDHIRCISEKDRGQSDAMNRGIALAQGRILGFLNVDDFYEPEVLNRVAELLMELPEPVFLVGNCNVIDAADMLLFVNRPARLRLQDILLAPTINPWPINPSAYFYSKSLHERVGLYDLRENFALDLEFLLRALPAAHVRYRDEIWGNFRLIEGTKTFCDKESGNNLNRIDAVLASFRKELPPLIQRYFSLYRAAVLLGHWCGYYRKPRLFTRVLAAKLRRRFGGNRVT